MDYKNYQNQGGYPPQEYPPNQGYPPSQGYAPNQGYPPTQGFPPPPQNYDNNYQQYPQAQYNQYAQQTSPQASQPYVQQSDFNPQPPTYNPDPSGSYQPDVNSSEKFSSKTRFNDIWAAILFFVHLVAFVVMSYFVLRNLNFKDFNSNPNNPNTSNFGNSTTFIAFGVGGVLAGILGLLYVILMQFAARILIIISFWFSVVLYLAVGAYFVYKKVYFAGVIMLIFACLYAWLWFSWKSRIPFSTILLKNVAIFTRRYPGTIFVGFVFLVLTIGYIIYWSFVLLGAIQDNSAQCKGKGPNCKPSGGIYGIYVFSAFSLFWTTQLFKDLSHMTVSGAFASDYFFPSNTQAASKFTSFSSLGRALTTSFGSACFGSLLVAIIRLLKTLAREARQGSDNFIFAILACCAECILAQIEALIEYFNTYAYCYCAMYGMPYVQAGKATWNLIKDRGVEAIINDSLVGNVLTLGSILISVISAAVSFGIVSLTQPNADSGLIAAVVIISFFIALLVTSVIFQVIESAITSFFVCLAEDPQALASYNPELFESIRQTYPQVVTPV